MRSLWVLGCRCQERNTQMRYRIYIRSALWEATEGQSSWKCCGGVAIPKVSMVYWKLPLPWEFLAEQPRNRVPTTKMEWRMVQWSTAKWGSIWCQRAYRTPSFAEVLGRLSLIVKLVSFSLMSSRDSFWYPDIHDTLWICMHASPFWPWMYLDVHGYRWQTFSFRFCQSSQSDKVDHIVIRQQARTIIFCIMTCLFELLPGSQEKLSTSNYREHTWKTN